MTTKSKSQISRIIIRNILKIDVKTKEVARMVCAMVGAVFAKTTGAQIPIDGGSERVI